MLRPHHKARSRSHRSSGEGQEDLLGLRSEVGVQLALLREVGLHGGHVELRPPLGLKAHQPLAAPTPCHGRGDQQQDPHGLAQQQQAHACVRRHHHRGHQVRPAHGRHLQHGQVRPLGIAHQPPREGRAAEAAQPLHHHPRQNRGYREPHVPAPVPCGRRQHAEQHTVPCGENHHGQVRGKTQAAQPREQEAVEGKPERKPHPRRRGRPKPPHGQEQRHKRHPRERPPGGVREAQSQQDSGRRRGSVPDPGRVGRLRGWNGLQSTVRLAGPGKQRVQPPHRITVTRTPPAIRGMLECSCPRPPAPSWTWPRRLRGPPWRSCRHRGPPR